MDGGVDSLSLLAPVGDPQYRRLRPTLAVGDGRRSPRTGGSPGIPPPRRWPTCTARARSRCCPRSATPTPTSRTSRRATSGRSARSTRTCARAGSAACSTASARPTTRSRASRWTGSSRRRWRPRATRSRRSTSPRTPASGRRVRGARPRTSPCPAFTNIGHALRGSARRGRGAGRAGGGVRGRRARRARAAGQGRQAGLHARGRLPAVLGGLPEAPGGLRRDARRRAADPRRLDQRAGRLRHARQPGGVAAQEPEADVRLAARLPARHRGARAGRPRAHARVVGVRAPRAGERLGHRPRRRRLRLPDRHPRGGPDGRRVPGPVDSSTRTATCAPPPTTAASTGRCAATGSASTRPPSCRTRAASAGR